MKKILFTSAALVFSANISATQLVYTPVNPAFGGSYLNGQYLLNNALAQNDHEPESSGGTGYVAPTALERLASSLESRLMSQLFNDAANGNEGYLKTDDFEINVVNEDGTLLVHITDLLTGETTIIEVGGLVSTGG
ncbi:curli assembly protein CsgF [Shewanella sp. 1_MG-2023]|uniref:Curli production assembly/transport component CsgF n=1 Tax=Shewanella electrodiphila TaxID=934143 RepID=A0ABT0KNI7_9GAMM|nr:MULTISPECIES: curli assembly protein CsgF [Shewanella]MCC4831426.1 curli assembly protein CsgF [Shewanella sp. 10N.7]MCL1045264.1 curli assembly protein CsgF [Shewanella electrodiphila]MDO6611906.1 curli assembly protein CsgF [Shewanella sp. 7_MG-2023]MDO6771761.1 curli assembly protein CsgF [Shewanella sp. 2_MG-2023]MDO6793987.1 curli assembly protein CsgF [Shewanella sp. 1_MG-2023]